MQAYSGQLLVCHTDAELGVLSNQHLFLGEGGTDSSETDDDRSALPLMCTYLPIGKLCHRDLCLKYLTHFDFRHLQHFVPTPSHIRRAELGESVALLSPPSTQSSLQGERWVYLWEELERIIYSHSLCCHLPKGRLYYIFMNDPVY